MHGIIFVELKKFVDARLGDAAWTEILERSELADRLYLPVQEYADSEVVTLIAQTVARAGLDHDGLLRQLGEFMAPDLLRMYGSLLDREWRTLEVVEHAASTMHRVLRARNADVRGVSLSTARVGPDELVVTYGSARRMCGLAKGIVRGLALHFGERVSIDEPCCMGQGAPECCLHLRRA